MKAKQVTIDESRLNTITCGPLPGSRKIYLPGKIHPSLRVPVREISQTPTQQSHSSGKDISLNPSVISYDTSGPYTDTSVTIDIRQGLAPIRLPWILERNDVNELEHISSRYGKLRLADKKLDSLRFRHLRKPLRAQLKCNVSQMHYARRGIITPGNGIYRHSGKSAS